VDAVIFDMDGVIVDSEIHWKTAEGYFLQSVIPAWKSSDQDKIIGIGVHDLYTLLSNEYGLQKTEEQFLELYQEMADEIYGQKVSLLEGFSDLLATCIAIEDSKNGVLSAKNAGMFCIGLRNGFNEEQDLSMADMVISGFAELDRDVLGRLLHIQ